MAFKRMISVFLIQRKRKQEKHMLRVRVLVAMAMAIGARAAITENIAHVTNIQTSPPAVEFVNTGQKAITGVAIRRLSPLPTDVIWADFYESPI
jgi:hypothetical protein